MNEKFEELFSKLSKLKIVQEDGDWNECIPEDIWKEYFEDNFKTVASNLLVDTHRWYETSIEVVKIFDNFLGIRYVSNMYSENMGYEDCFYTVKFYRMEEFHTVSYREIKA